MRIVVEVLDRYDVGTHTLLATGSGSQCHVAVCPYLEDDLEEEAKGVSE
jgi:hypothetical protein